MSTLKRAVLYLIRKRMRSILLFSILFFMGLFVLVSLSIRSSADKAAADMRKSISTGLKLEMHEISGDKIYHISSNETGELVRTLKIPLITETVAKELASIDGVSGYYSEMGAEILYTGLAVQPGMYTNALLSEMSEEDDPEEWENDKIWAHANDFRIVQESEFHPHFTNGALELVEGRHLNIDDSGKILISEELSERNNLQIGDYVDGRNFDPVSGEKYGEVYHAEIVGIFRINFEEQISEWTAEPKILSNTIFGPFELRHWGQVQYNTFYGGNVLAKEVDRLLGSITLFVEDPADLNEVEQRVKENTLVDWNYYSVSRYDSDYKAAARPLLSMVLITTIMMIVMIGGALLILSLILAMWMRGRKQEIHILYSIGISRNTVLGQFLAEITVIAVLAFSVSWMLADPSAHIIGDVLTEITNPAENAMAFGTTYEPATGITHINRAPIRQETLPYSVTPAAAMATLFTMMTVSWGTIVFTFMRTNGRFHISGASSVSHHWRLKKKYREGTLKAHHRALLYVARKTGKSTLLFLTMFAIMMLFLFGMSVRMASDNAAAQLRASIGGYFKVMPDYRKSDVENQITKEFMEQIQTVKGIRSSNAMDVCYMNVQNLLLKAGKFSSEGDKRACMTRVLGNTDTSMQEYFYLGILELKEGCHIRAADKGTALISEELARLNNLSVGDCFELQPSEESGRYVSSAKEYKVRIVGIFSEAQQTQSSEHTAECDIPANFIFTDIATTQQSVQEAQLSIAPVYSGGAVFFVEDPKEINQIADRVQVLECFDADHTYISVNNAAYQNSMEPLQRLGNMSLIMLLLITVLGVVLLTLILALWERDRIHEAGILMSFGLSKKNILWQHFIECAAVFFVAFFLATVVFLPLGEKVGTQLYEHVSQRSETVYEAERLEEQSVNSELIEADISFEMGMSPVIFVIAGFAGILFTGVAVTTAFLIVVRRKPRELLTVME